jgi:hypothetical protein
MPRSRRLLLKSSVWWWLSSSYTTVRDPTHTGLLQVQGSCARSITDDTSLATDDTSSTSVCSHARVLCLRSGHAEAREVCVSSHSMARRQHIASARSLAVGREGPGRLIYRHCDHVEPPKTRAGSCQSGWPARFIVMCHRPRRRRADSPKPMIKSCITPTMMGRTRNFSMCFPLFIDRAWQRLRAHVVSRESPNVGCRRVRWVSAWVERAEVL